MGIIIILFIIAIIFVLRHQASKQKKRATEQKINEYKSVTNPIIIVSAGKSLKKIVYIATFLVLCITGVLSVIAFSIKIGSPLSPFAISDLYLYTAIVSLICNVFILTTLYNAGDYLENSQQSTIS
jgi:quinol-cytochrome oxidoreductase complex cytochrome b subunit